MRLILAQPTGRINVRGANGAGKSTLLDEPQVRGEDARLLLADRRPAVVPVRAGRRTRSRPTRTAIRSTPSETKKRASRPASGSCARLQEIVRHTDAPIYLLDEWDANLDPNNRAAADALVEELARRARVVEISHRDRV